MNVMLNWSVLLRRLANLWWTLMVAPTVPPLKSETWVSYLTKLSPHIKYISNSAFFDLRNISQLWPWLTCSVAETLIHAFVTRLDCNGILFGAPNRSLDRLAYVQNSVARVLTCAHYPHSAPYSLAPYQILYYLQTTTTHLQVSPWPQQTSQTYYTPTPLPAKSAPRTLEALPLFKLDCSQWITEPPVLQPPHNPQLWLHLHLQNSKPTYSGFPLTRLAYKPLT